MSSSNVLKLPSFDHADETVIVESEPLELEIVETEEELALPVEIDDAEDHWEPDPEPDTAVGSDLPDLTPEMGVEAEPEPEIDPAQERLDAAERLLEELSGTASMLQLEVAARVEEVVQSMTAALFPKLAEDFLAEEISRFLAYAVPKNTLRVDVFVPGPLEAGLSECVTRNKALQDFCLVHALQGDAAPIVKANWGEGGFEYDLTSLLAACHARTFQNGNEVEE